MQEPTVPQAPESLAPIQARRPDAILQPARPLRMARATKKKLLERAAEIAAELGSEIYDPFEYLMRILITGEDPIAPKMAKSIGEVASNVNPRERAKMLKRDGFVSREERNQIALALMPYLYPKLANMQVTGADGGPVQLLNVVDAAKDPVIRAAMERLQEMGTEPPAEASE